MSVGYGAGFLCHLALDSACHGYVDERSADGPISHMAMEGEFDRMLMESDGLDTVSQAHLPTPPQKGSQVWDAAACAYIHASPRQVRRAYRAMNFYLGFFARSCGTRRGKVIGAVSRMLPIQSAKDVALKETIPPLWRAAPIWTGCWRVRWMRPPSRSTPFSRPSGRTLRCLSGLTGISRARPRQGRRGGPRCLTVLCPETIPV